MANTVSKCPRPGDLRVIARDDADGARIQYLQRKRRFFGWRTLDQEVVPGHVVISLGAFGDTGGWMSKFTELGTFDRDGWLTPHQKLQKAG